MDNLLRDEEAERRIQDAAQVLVDLCLATQPPDPDMPAGEDAHKSSALGLAIQAIFISDVRLGTIEERLAKAQLIEVSEIRMRAFGLGLGVGHSLGMMLGLSGKATAMQAFSLAMNAALAERQNLRPRDSK
jgi:hypothetical protein